MMGCEQQTACLSPIGSQLSSAFGKQRRSQHRAEMGVLHYSLILFLHITSDPFGEVNCEPAFSRLSAGNWPLCSRYVRKGLDKEQTRRRNGNDPVLLAMLGHHGRQWQIPGCSHRDNGTCGTVSLRNQTISQENPISMCNTLKWLKNFSIWKCLLNDCLQCPFCFRWSLFLHL